MDVTIRIFCRFLLTNVNMHVTIWLHMSEFLSPFKAISDQTRRQILDLLRDEKHLSAGSIAKSFPAISRPAVSKHLAILRQSNLVKTQRKGREWQYSLNPAPLHQVMEWLSYYQSLWDQQMASFKKYVEFNNENGGFPS